MLPDVAVSFDGPMAAHAHTTDGILFEDFSCEACRTRIYNSNSAAPGMIFLRAGTLSDSHRLAPIAHIWTKRKQPWVNLPEDIPSFDESPTPEEFAAAVQQARARRTG